MPPAASVHPGLSLLLNSLPRDLRPSVGLVLLLRESVWLRGHTGYLFLAFFFDFFLLRS